MKVAAFNAKNSNVYHNNSKCTEGNNIEKVNLQKGHGGKTLCSHCKRLNSNR